MCQRPRKLRRFLELCDRHRIPVISLCDTSGFLVGPDVERDGGVRHFSQLMVAAAPRRRCGRH